MENNWPLSHMHNCPYNVWFLKIGYIASVSCPLQTVPNKTNILSVVHPAQLTPSYIQGDTSGCDEPPVDIKTKVPFWPGQARPKRKICFEVNWRFGTT